MTPNEDLLSFEKQVRFQVYTQFVTTGRAPTIGEVAYALSCSRPEVQAAYQRLAAGKALVLQESGEVLMAEPFSAVPTPFTVEVGTREAMTLEVRDSMLQYPHAGVVHLAIPPREWWNDVVFA